MNKQEFLAQLRRELSGLPKADAEERLTFCSEMIDDRMEDGIPEETAVDEIGPIDGLVEQMIADIPLTRLVKEKIKPKKELKTGEILLLALGSPIWLSLLLAAFAVVISVYAVLWAVMIALWAVFVSLAVCALAGIVAGICFAVTDNLLTGIAVIGAGCICIGLSVFMFFGCKAATKGLLSLTGKLAIRIKTTLSKRRKHHE